MMKRCGIGVFSAYTLAACVGSDPELGELQSASTVGDYTGSGCSTAVVIGLSKQIADEGNCIHPGAFVPFASGNGITLTSSAVVPYLEKSGRDDLVRVAANNSLQINSALRTVASQYLLVQWFNEGRCGISAAAAVGRSNHEGGRAVDVSNYSSRITAMRNRGWMHDVSGDPVHFDHTASPDGRGQDVLAFQRLWNRNNTTDHIAEDGLYGPQTEARLRKSPATGFPIGAMCLTGAAAPSNVESVSGPDQVPSSGRAHYAITLRNTGTVDWTDTTKLVVASGQPSQLYDSQSWMSPTEAVMIGAVPAGAETVVELDVQAPSVMNDTAIDEPMSITDGTQQFGSLDLAMTVVMGAGGNSGDSGDTEDVDPGTTTGGCSTGSPGTGALLVVALGLVARRRRR
jgi:uncharacterized protein (TIGR03382 family)